ncbi:hypothetical protein [Leptobacterium sp. I13]|uniref:hypothetical protein n=1 Tax=Leptobacterium meishanense TaxID=3128904 RepID=UPI0030EBD0B8
MKNSVYIYLLLILFGCSDKNSKQKTKSDFSQKEDSLIEAKYNIKEQIFEQYLRIPLSIFESNDGVDYSKYEEFIRLDSLLDQYSRDYLLLDKEKQLLAITKSKEYLILSKYSKVIRELEAIPNNSEYENYKNLLLGVSYDLKGDSVNSKKHFKELLAKFEYSNQSVSDCEKYILVNVLSDSKEINFCKDYLKEYEQMRNTDKIELIKTYILGDLEL